MSVVDIDDEDDDKWLDYIRTVTVQQRYDLFVKSAAEGELWRMERLLEKGIDQQTLDKALDTAVAGGKEKIVRLLIDHHADPAHEGSVPLWHATMQDKAVIADILLQAGADVNASNGALMGIALSHRNTDTALVLLRHGADPSRDFKDKNAFEWAAEMHLEDFFQTLRKWVESDVYRGPSFFKAKSLEELRQPMPGRKGRTGFHVAAAAGAFDVVAEKIMALPGEMMRAEDLLREVPPNGPSVLVVLGQTGQLKDAFDARLWAGRKREMLETFAHVPQLYRSQVDLDAVASAIDQLALKISQRKFTLKP